MSAYPLLSRAVNQDSCSEDSRSVVSRSERAQALAAGQRESRVPRLRCPSLADSSLPPFEPGANRGRMLASVY